MSLYNLLNGVDISASTALAMIGKRSEDFGRFRDAWISENGKHVEVFTRCGGGNREEYEKVFSLASTDSLYVRDFDDDFDSTYATIVFRIPDPFLLLAERLKPEEKRMTLRQKTESAIESIKQVNDPKDEAVIDKVNRIEKIIRGAIAEENGRPPAGESTDEVDRLRAIEQAARELDRIGLVLIGHDDVWNDAVKALKTALKA